MPSRTGEGLDATHAATVCCGGVGSYDIARAPRICKEGAKAPLEPDTICNVGTSGAAIAPIVASVVAGHVGW